jgi:putative resolvase
MGLRAMKLSVWAKKQGIAYKTAHKWFQEGKIPHEVVQMPSGAIIVKEDVVQESDFKVAIYTRVSSYERKDCLDGLLERCTAFANSKGLQVTKEH